MSRKFILDIQENGRYSRSDGRIQYDIVISDYLYGVYQPGTSGCNAGICMAQNAWGTGSAGCLRRNYFYDSVSYTHLMNSHKIYTVFRVHPYNINPFSGSNFF